MALGERLCSSATTAQNLSYVLFIHDSLEPQQWGCGRDTASGGQRCAESHDISQFTPAASNFHGAMSWTGLPVHLMCLNVLCVGYVINVAL